MKFVMALCALFLAVQANAATVTAEFRFQTKLIEEWFFPPIGWQPNYPSSYNSPGHQIVTLNDNPYNTSGMLSGIRDGQWHDSYLLLTYTPNSGANVSEANVISCQIGPYDCDVGGGYFYYDGQFIAGAVYQGYNGVKPSGQLIFKDLYAPSSAQLLNDAASCTGTYQSAPIDCQGYAAYMEIRPISNVPLPAGGALLLTAMAGLSLSRRSRSRFHPQ